LIALFIFCSEEEEKFIQNRKITMHRFLQFEKFIFEPVSWEDVMDIEYSDFEKQRIAANTSRIILGTPEQVEEQLSALAVQCTVDEIMIDNIAQNLQDRLQSYELIAHPF
jgi:alkanesulfonate monooxygenase SsuD/methylene tetrahydromethanopterin reductase-like flavin-dependent oxidoreductase (luciferase family)